MELMESGMVEDLTGLFDQWASPLYKATIESFGGLENAMPTTFVNGRQYANALTHGSGQDPLFWIREDWRLKLGLPEPQTTDDFIKLAQAFVDNDMAGNKMTAGLEIQVPMAGTYNTVMMADPYFTEAGSYPRLWIDDSTGKIVYGSVAPQAKEGLRTLRDLYAKGLIPRDFVTRDHQAAVAAGYPGVVIGSWWISDWPLNYSVNNNPNALWRVYTWKSSKTGKRHTFQQPYNFSWAVVRKGYKNPEILTRLMNLTAEVRCFFDGPCLTAEEEKQYEIIIPLDVRDAYAGRQNINWTSWPINLQIDFNDQMVRLARIQQQNLDKYKAGNTSGIDASTLATLKNIVNYEKGTDRGFRAWSDYQRYVGMHYSLTDASTIDIKKTYWPYNTETMQLRWSNLTDLEALAYNKIIMGQEPLDYFDVFVKEWYDQGGTRITEEVNRQFGK
jgi:putative aldouronate transport system substrate-binding protein